MPALMCASCCGWHRDPSTGILRSQVGTGENSTGADPEQSHSSASCELRRCCRRVLAEAFTFIYRHFCGTQLNAVVEILQREEYLEPFNTSESAQTHLIPTANWGSESCGLPCTARSDAGRWMDGWMDCSAHSGAPLASPRPVLCRGGTGCMAPSIPGQSPALQPRNPNGTLLSVDIEGSLPLYGGSPTQQGSGPPCCPPGSPRTPGIVLLANGCN